MKRLLVAACITLASFASQADPLAFMLNKAGGKIVLTKARCEDKNRYIAFSTHPENTTLFGCWFADGMFVHITWNNNRTVSYDLQSWTPVKNETKDAL